MRKRTTNYLYSKILIINYFSTKLYVYNIISTMNIYKNKEILKKRRTRLLNCYTKLNFIIKKSIWQTIFNKLHYCIKNKIHFGKNKTFLSLLNFKSKKLKQSNVNFRKMEFLLNQGI
jgi:hypothetical protein